MVERKTGIVRTTISLPVDLRRRMDQVKEHVNWSAIAGSAFEEKLKDIASKREKETMDEVIQRLRVSKRESASANYKYGFEEGYRWAKQRATVTELDQLETHYEVNLLEQDDAAESLFSWMQGCDPNARTNLADFWAEMLNDNKTTLYRSADFVRGFAEGALELWDEVKDKI